MDDEPKPPKLPVDTMTMRRLYLGKATQRDQMLAFLALADLAEPLESEDGQG